MEVKKIAQIWKEARSSRAEALGLHAEDLAGWIAERIGRDIVEHGQQGSLNISFLEAHRNGALRNLYSPEVLRFNGSTQVFVTPCGSEFTPEEMFSPISDWLRKSGIDAQLAMSGNSLVVQHSPNETRIRRNSRAKKEG
jgi:hypothetical protein